LILYLFERIKRKFEYEPDYKVKIRYLGREIPCEIYTNVFILDEGKIFCDKLNFSTSLDGNFYFRLNISNPFMVNLEKQLEREIIDFIRNQNKFKNVEN